MVSGRLGAAVVPMRLRRLVAVLVLVALLSASVAAGNAAVAAERTVLSGGFVKATLEEEDAYGTARTFVVEQATAPAAVEAGSPEDATGGPPAVFGNATGRIVEEAVTEDYLQAEAERNVDATYAYLHGEREALVVAVDLEPVQDEVTDILAQEIRNASLADIFGALGDGEPSVPVGGTSVNLTLVGEMAESPEAYDAARAEFRADVRESVVERLVDQAFDAASDDERLALVVPDYDPGAYSAPEKSAMVEDREPEIRAAIADRIEAERGEEIDAAVDEQLDRLASVNRDDLAAQLNASGDGLPPGIGPPVADLAATGVAGLATDMPYETFVAETDDAKARLAANVSALVGDEMATAGTDQFVLVDSREPSSGEGFALARQAVGVVDLLSVLLPLLALGLVGGLWWLTRSAATVAGGAGVALLLGGLPGYVAARMAGEWLDAALGGVGMPGVLSRLLLAVADRVLRVVATQSLALVVSGLVLVAAAAYLHVYGPPEWLARRLGTRGSSE